MKGILFWIVPPLAGAIIGYVTNVVAIRMLFRPLREIRLFGIRLPFTPSILPRERQKLADSIGAMVERELLTPEVLRERLARKEVREEMGNTLGSYTGQLLKRPLSDLFEDSSADLPLSELFADFVNSEVFDSFLEEIIRIWAGLKASPSEEGENHFGFWLKSQVRNVGAMLVPTARDLIKNGFVRQIKNQARGKNSLYAQALENVIEKYPGITLGEFLSMGESKKQRLDSFLTEKAVSTLDENIEGALSSVDVKALVSDRINSLDMLRVERIILDVMAGQLKWIDIFGGILGGLIGFFQVLLSLLTSRI